MSFIVRCPFCKSEMDVPNAVRGRVGRCTSCRHEIDMEPVDDPPPAHPNKAESTSLSPVAAARAAVLAAQPTVMPRVTWSWAFDFVLKVSVAAALIDGLLAFAFGFLWGLLHSSARY
jgi:hypothetical protein